MAPFRSRGLRRVALGIVIPLGGICVDAPAQSPSGNDEETLDEARASFEQWSAVTDEYESAIVAEESRNGPHSPDLLDPLVALGFAHQEYGRHDLAMASIERALQVKRVNDGLYNLDQVPIIEQLVDSARAMGDAATAAELEDRMIRLARLNPDDPRRVVVLVDAADRQLAVYQRFAAEGFPPTFSINTSYNGSPVQSSGGSPPRASFGLWQAQGNYADAIRTLLRQGQYTGDELVELEGKLIYSYYLELNGASLSPIRSATLFSLAREAHRRLIAYSLYDTGAATDFAKALVALADWDLMFSMNARAIERYEQAYRLMVSAGASESTIREIFAPQTPVMLPSFAKNPLALRAVDETVGHIDVAFETSKYGKSRKIRVVDASSGTTKTAERDLVRLIASSRFRPRVTEDETIAAAPYRLRYYVSE